MTNIVDHPQPCLPSSVDATTMTVSLAPFGMPNRYERLIVEPASDGQFVVACLPYFTYGIQFGDLVEMHQPSHEFERVLKHAGLRTLRFAFNEPELANQVHEQLHGNIVASGLPHEWRGSGYLAVLLRHREDQERALSCLGDFATAEYGSWEVDPEPFA